MTNKTDTDKWIKIALNPKNAGQFSSKAKVLNMSTLRFANIVIKRLKGKKNTIDEIKLLKQAVLARTLINMKK